MGLSWNEEEILHSIIAINTRKAQFMVTGYYEIFLTLMKVLLVLPRSIM
jgi:hypothetical protein